MSLQGQWGTRLEIPPIPTFFFEWTLEQRESTAKVAEYLENNNNDSAIDQVLCNKVVIVLREQFTAVYTLLC